MTVDLVPRPAIRVCLLRATGTIGRATLRALMRRGYDVVCLVRRRPDGAPGVNGPGIRLVDMRDPASTARDGFRGERFDAVVSCMASRTGALSRRCRNWLRASADGHTEDAGGGARGRHHPPGRAFPGTPEGDGGRV